MVCTWIQKEFMRERGDYQNTYDINGTVGNNDQVGVKLHDSLS